MNKKTIFAAALALLVAGGVFAQKYTVYLGGTFSGTIAIQKDGSGKITITPDFSSNGWGNVWLGKSICPILPYDGFFISTHIKSIVIDGNTTTETYSGGSWEKTVIDGNTTTVTNSDGSWYKAVVDGNTMTETMSSKGWFPYVYVSASSVKTVREGNTVTRTFIDCDYVKWQRIVVTKNTMAQTDSQGQEVKAEIKGKETWRMSNGGSWYEIIDKGERRIHRSGSRTTYERVEKNKITIYEDGAKPERKTVVETQGNDITITIKGDPFAYIGVSEKERIQCAIDGIKSGKLRPGMFYMLLSYER
ncbi:MAG: hypothetical protein Pg6C_11210 [Treponemataceae bacterium]|nr:MAG: hypothetical protein Pg6C_11210 [Treponemataceae bacterium]